MALLKHVIKCSCRARRCPARRSTTSERTWTWWGISSLPHVQGSHRVASSPLDAGDHWPRSSTSAIRTGRHASLLLLAGRASHWSWRKGTGCLIIRSWSRTHRSRCLLTWRRHWTGTNVARSRTACRSHWRVALAAVGRHRPTIRSNARRATRILRTRTSGSIIRRTRFDRFCG